MAGKRIPFAATVTPNRQLVSCIYARISFDKDERQIGVMRQEEECRQVVAREDFLLEDEGVFIDNSRSAWQRSRKRPAWDAMLEGIRNGEFDAVVCYHPDRLVRQPRDLEDLIDAAYASNKRYRRPVRLVGKTYEKNLNDPDALTMLRFEVTIAEKSSADTSRRVKSKLAANFELDLVHGGHRAFGYEPGGLTIRQSEAEVIRDVAERVLKGDPVRTICKDLNARGILTARQKQWSNATLWAMLTGPRVAGLRQRHGQIVGTAPWPEILDIDTWNAIQTNAEIRSAKFNAELEAKDNAPRYYLLRGIVHCGDCGAKMTGERTANGRPRYRCRSRPGSDNCGQLGIMAEALEEFIVKTALDYLERLDLSSREEKPVVDPQIKAEMEEDKELLKMLAAALGSKRMKHDEYWAAKAEVDARIDMRNLNATPQAVRPMRSLTGLAGAGVRRRWAKLTPQRQNAVLKDVFETVVIERNGRQFTRFVEAGYLDYDRVRLPKFELVEKK